MDFILVEKDMMMVFDEDLYGSEDCSSWCYSWMDEDGDDGRVDCLPSDPFGMVTVTGGGAGYDYYNVDDYDDDFAGYCNPIEFLPSDPFDMEAVSKDCLHCDVDDRKEGDSSKILAQRPKGERFMDSEGSPSSAGADAEEEISLSMHEGLMLSLGYLGVEDLLSVEMVCRALRSAVREDSLLWRCIHICSPFSERITDETLFRLTQKAHGRLQCLSLVTCTAITDDGLKRVLESNPRLTKLSLPECARLTIEGLLHNLSALKASGALCLKHLRLGRLFKITNEHYEELNALLGIEQLQEAKACKPQFYHRNLPLRSCYVERAVDIEICPRCQKSKLVFDCPSDSCQGEEASDKCRACDVCIPRCVHCGRCIKNREFLETFLLDYLCSACWKQPTQCQDRVNKNAVV